MKMEEIRQLSKEDLQYRLEDALEELGNLRFQHSTHQLDNPLLLQTFRRDIARMKTVLHEYELRDQK